MTEHIIDTTDGFLGDAVDLHALFGPRLREEVVRCRDCENISFNPLISLPICKWFGCLIEDVNGFCAWGRRRDDNELQ